jgi:hypothetical protein
MGRIQNVLEVEELRSGWRLLPGQRRIDFGPDNRPESGKPIGLGLEMTQLGLADPIVHVGNVLASLDLDGGIRHGLGGGQPLDDRDVGIGGKSNLDDPPHGAFDFDYLGNTALHVAATG